MIKFLIPIMVMTLLFTGCGSSSDPLGSQPSQTQQEQPNQPGAATNPGNSNPNTNPQTGDGSGDDKNNPPSLATRSVKSFTLSTKNVLNLDSNKTGLNGFHIKIERGTTVVYDNISKQLDLKLVVNQDDSITFTGFNDLQTGDKITFDADGFISQQKVVDQSVLDNMSMTLVLKPIDSRQTFVLGDLDSGRVTSRYTRGASVKVDHEKVTFKTNNDNVALSIDKSGLDALIKKVKRSPKADKNTEIYLDITSIDPKTELDSSIGDLTYSPSFEPASERTTSAVQSADTMLESVVMTSITMTTSNGEEIHCFGGGAYDESKEECVGDTSRATLRMKIPASQFEQYAKKYNEGDKVVPLYHYSKSKATWVRQLDNDHNPVDAELVLEDNNNDKIANEGDILYLEGEVGHFSYWNGDYPRELSFLKGVVEIASGAQLPDGTVVVAEGSDYTGRTFQQAVSSDELAFNRLGAKANAKVKLYLRYPNGAKSKAIYAQTGDEGEVTDVGTLLCEFQAHNVTVTVVDTEGNVLPNVSIKAGNSTHVTDADGKTTVSIASEGLTKVTASYDTGDFVTKAAKFIDSDATLILDTTAFTISGAITFKDQNGDVLDSRDAFVEVIVGDIYKRVYADNGKYNVKLPANAVKADTQIKLFSGIFVPLYARTMTKEEVVSVDADAKKAEKKVHDIDFKLEAFIVSGRVVNPFAPKASMGLSGITVYSGDQVTQTDDNGYYEMVLFDKEVTHEIYAYDPEEYEYAKPYPVLIGTNPSDDELKGNDFIIDKREAVVSGSVVNMKGVPVQGVVLYTSPGWYQTFTDDEGKFEFHLSDRSLYGEEIKIYAYDSNDQSKILATKTTGEAVAKGKNIDIGDIVINNNLPPVIDAVSTTTPMLDQPLVITIQTHDPENDALETTVIFDGEEYPVTEGEAVITPLYTGTLTYTIKVKETDTSDAYETVRTQSFLVRANAKPVIDTVSGFNADFDKKENMQIVVSAHDPEGATLGFSAKLLSYGVDYSDYLEVQNSTFTIAKNLPDGVYILKIQISDGINTIEKNFQFEASSNTPPANLQVLKDSLPIGDTVHVKVTDQITLVAQAEDAEGDSLIYEWQFNEGLATADGNMLTIHPAVGIFTISVYVSDGEQGVSKTFKMVIADNLKPVVNEINIQPAEIVKVGDHYEDGNGNTINTMTVTVDAFDPEGTSLTYKFSEIQTLSPLAVAEDINNTKIYSLENIPAGRQAFKVEIKDADGYVTSKRVLFMININKPPVIDALFVPVKSKVGQTLSLQTSATDPEGNTLTYQWKVVLDGKDIAVTNQNSKLASFIVPQNATGKIEVTMKVSDGTNEIVRKRNIEVVQNNAPRIHLFKVLPTVLKEGKEVQFSAEVSDPEFDALSYTWLYDGEVLDAFNDKTAGVMTVSNPGEHNLTLQVSDGDKSAEKSETITVQALAAKPVVTLDATQNMLLPGAEVTINADVQADGSYSLRWFGEGLSGENLASAKFSALTPGEYRVGVVATNVDGIASDEAIVTLQVKEIVAEIQTAQITQELGNDFIFTAKLSDGTPVPTNTSWSLLEKPEGSQAVITANGVTATLTPDLVGTYKAGVTFAVSDIAGAFEATQAVTVKEAGTVGEVVEGKVTDNNGDVLEGVKVRLYNISDSTLYDQTITTDTDGNYTFTAVPPGTYYLVISGGNNYINQTQKITIQ